MAFLTNELSNYGGEPILLYEFTRGTIRYLYAAADQNVTLGTDTYVAEPISSSAMTQRGQPVTDAFTIDMPYSLDVAKLFLNTPPSDPVYVKVHRFHYGDTEAVILYVGSIVTCAVKQIGQVTLSCQAVSVSLVRQGLRMTWQRGCIHALYDHNCGVPAANYAYNTTVTGVATNMIAISGTLSLPAAFTMGYAGGYVEWLVGTNTYERRGIESHTVNGFYPLGGVDGYSVGQAITLYPGCARTHAYCDQAFNNHLNYGGFPFMPGKSPYDGDPVF